MGLPSALRDLFAADAPAQGPGELPSAIRPAVEIIARLSAERARLRTDLAHLREELRRSDAARGTTAMREQLDAARAEQAKLKSERDALAAELERVRAERDALRGERDALKSQLQSSRVERRTLAAAPSAEQSASLVRLLDRLERAVARFESPASSPTPLREPPASRAGLPAREANARPPMAPANSFMAALLRDNVNLRAAVEPAEPAPAAVEEPAPAPAAERPLPAPEPAPRPMPRGMLGALVAENARLRRRTASGSAPRNRLESTTARRRAQSLDRLTA